MIQAVVTGNLGRDAELKSTQGGSVLSFSVASGRKVKGEEQTTWVRCSLWGKRGEALAVHLTKGSKVAVAGELFTREHDGKTYVELRVSEIDLMGSKGGSRSAAPRNDEPTTPDAGTGDDDGDIPF